MDGLLAYLQSLSLSQSNREWLADKLVHVTPEPISEEVTKAEQIAGFEHACHEAKLYQEGKIQLPTLQEALDELRG